MRVFERSIELPASAARVFGYHASPLAFARLTPPWEDTVVVEPLRRLENGARAVIEVGAGPARVRWVARHENVNDGSDGGVAGFVDVAERGPFSAWRHEHRIEPLPDDASGAARCRLVDRITWTGPAAGLGDVVGRFFVDDKLERMFRFRHDTMRDDLALVNALSSTRPLKVGVTGASGLIGAEVCALLSVAGHDVKRFVRRRASADDDLSWDPATGVVDERTSGLDAVVHLAGENIAAGRLDDDKRARLRDQRVAGTARLLASLAALPQPPRVVVSAGAIGFYGERGDEVLNEQSPRGQGFLAELCAEWEWAALATSSTSLSPWRAVSLRFGVVLSPRGGALQKALPAFAAGVGGPFGDGRAWMPLLSVDDAAGIVLRALIDERLSGVVCAVGAQPARNREFAAALGRVLHRPAAFPVPRLALKAVLGDVADHVLESCRVEPQRLREVGHVFRHDTVEHALRHVLGRW
jgi:uncharacterized protein (TIGR01777 family)